MPTYERNGHQVTTTEGDPVDRRLSRLKSWTRVDEGPDVPPPGADEREDDDAEPDGDDTERIVGQFADVVDDASRVAWPDRDEPTDD